MSEVLDRPLKPLSKGAQTRERILDIAQASVLRQGFAATSIDALIFEAGITKSGFFYHFRDKNELARALILRFLEQDRAIMGDIFGRAAELSDDPLHAYLIGLKLLAELADSLPEGHPGCLVATYAYQDAQFDPEVRRLNAEGVLAWRRRFRGFLDAIAERYPPKIDLDLDILADNISAVLEGGIVLSRALREPKLLGQQVMAHRALIRAVFLG
jgi:TetR/AcrR family transcriptional regulator, transcriptional repressor for nem operon